MQTPAGLVLCPDVQAQDYSWSSLCAMGGDYELMAFLKHT